MAKLAPIFNDAQLINGIPANGAKLFTYVAGSTTKLATFTSEDASTPQANPIVLNARGEPAQPIWLADGLFYKFVFTAPNDTDPPTSPIRTIDDISGINDTALVVSQWVASTVQPTYVSATQFTLAGDQTSEFQVNRRVKLTVTAGTVYGYISVASYVTLTTVTVVLDSGVLDTGLTDVQLGLITPLETSLPKIPNFVETAQLAEQVFNDLTTVTLDPATDFFAIADTSDSGNKKKALLPLATDAEIKTGTANKLITPPELLLAQGFTSYFQSAEQTITSAGALTIAHGLPRKPILLFAFLINKTAELGYSVGDEVATYFYSGNAGAINGASIVADATNISIRYSSAATAYGIPNKTNGNAAAASNANWRLVIRAWG